MRWMGMCVLAGCFGGGRSPVDGSLPCSDAVAVYRVKAGKGGSLRVSVDTVAPDTTFDPAVSVWRVGSWDDGLGGVALEAMLASADDEFTCTFPPPQYACPQLVQSIPSQDEDLAVIVAVLGNCAGADAAYELTVELDGEPAKVSEWAVGSVDELDLPTPQDTGF